MTVGGLTVKLLALLFHTFSEDTFNSISNNLMQNEWAPAFLLQS
jgi:hypothetical protein